MADHQQLVLGRCRSVLDNLENLENPGNLEILDNSNNNDETNKDKEDDDMEFLLQAFTMVMDKTLRAHSEDREVMVKVFQTQGEIHREDREVMVNLVQ